MQFKMVETISLVVYHEPVDATPPTKRRERQPRVRNNPMALVAHRVMVEAERAYRTADRLAAAMESHLLQQISDSQIYQYTTEREQRNVPPGDVLLAAALAAGISIDQELGMVRQASDIEEMRVQITEMREEMASLRAALAQQAETPSDRAAARAERAAERRAWAQRSQAGGPPSVPSPAPRRSGRGLRP